MDIIGYKIIQCYIYIYLLSILISIPYIMDPGDPWWGFGSQFANMLDDPHYRWTGLKQSGKTWICHPFTGVWGMVVWNCDDIVVCGIQM